MIKSFEYPAKKSEFEAFVATNPDNQIWHDGAVMRVYTGDDIPVSAAVSSVSPRQIRLALTAAGLRATVETAVKSGSQDLKDWWEYALEIERHHPMIEAMGAQLGQTTEQIDALFNLAGSL